MKKIKILTTILSPLILLTSCQAMKHFAPLPYTESVEVTEKKDLRGNYEITDNSYDRTGYVYHYIKSNQDDSFAADVWIYYPDPFHSQSFKIYPISKVQGFLDCVCASYDKDTFRIKEIEGKKVKKNGKILGGIKASYDGYTRKVTMGKKEITNETGIMPTFDINFDLTDFNSMLPFLKDNKKDFSFGFTTINKKSFLASPVFLYLGKLDMKYEGSEVYKDQNCSVYSMSLENYEEKEGKVYINSENNDLVEINTSLCGNPFYDSFKLTLIEKYKTTDEEWLSFMQKHAKEEL